MSTPREYRHWNLRKFKDPTRIRMPRRWCVYHRPSGTSVGNWRDKGEARRWMRKTGIVWRQKRGIDGPVGWELRQDKTQYALC